MVYISLFLFLLGILGTPLVWLGQIIWAIADYFGIRDWYNRRLWFQQVDWEVEVFLAQHFRFYNGLTERDKVLFEKRVQKFMNMKTFEGRDGLVVTKEMKTLVSATAIQITFGFPAVYFKHFDRIILYPEAYYSPSSDNYHLGEVNMRGVIVLSWKNLVEGYADHGDGRNLGLHEMAHALRLADATKKEHNFLDDAVLREFLWYARHEMQLMANGEPSFFRDYAATNDHEFFAVAIENFFERPKEFQEYYPELYEVTKRLLKCLPASECV